MTLYFSVPASMEQLITHSRQLLGPKRCEGEARLHCNTLKTRRCFSTRKHLDVKSISVDNRHCCQRASISVTHLTEELSL